MKKFSKIVIIFSFFFLVCFSSCKREKEAAKVIRADCGKYGTIYQIVPYSFSDSDGDGIGDLKGITEKLDYIYSLGFTGVWLTPVHPSPSYHKYDVTDYLAIDRQFGTLDDYKEMVEKSHSLSMTVLLDLVFNHTSNSHSWFIQSAKSQKENDRNGRYYNYYNWSESKKPNYELDSVSGKYYECRFWGGMPDLNLQLVLDDPVPRYDEVTGKSLNLSADLYDIMKFWLVDYGVDGFRLDACTSYFSSTADTVRFLSWLNEKAKEIKPDCYLVGEGSWGVSPASNRQYYESGVDSFFNFDDALATGSIARVGNTQDATLLSIGISGNLSNCAQGLPAPFVVNHDLPGRLIGSSGGRESERLKFTYAIEAMYTGCIFHYYGDEIGMTVAPGSKADEDKRLPLFWGDKYTCKPVSGSREVTEKDAYPFGSVKKLLKEKDSSINFIAECNRIRNLYPAIMKGQIVQIFASEDKTFSANIKSYEEEKVLILVNASHTESYTYDYSSTDFYRLSGKLAAVSGTSIRQVKGEARKIIMPPLSVCVIAEQ